MENGRNASILSYQNRIKPSLSMKNAMTDGSIRHHWNRMFIIKKA